MKVILLADVYKHGVAGEVIEVADGFARNWLLPKQLAKKATSHALKEAAQLREQAEVRRAQLDQRLNELARMIDGVELVFGRRVSPTGKLFGSVTANDIVTAIKKAGGPSLDKRTVQLPKAHIKATGTHTVGVHLHPEVNVDVTLDVIAQG